MKEGTENGAIVKNGLAMLLLQAFAAWDIWNQELRKKIIVTLFSLLIIILQPDFPEEVFICLTIHYDRITEEKIWKVR